MILYYTIPRTTRELQQKPSADGTVSDYTIPRTTRELQPFSSTITSVHYYTIPRTTRELQLAARRKALVRHYTIPRATRELQLVKVFFANLKHYTIPRTTTGERGRARRGGIIPCKDLTVRTPALLLGNFCVAFFVRSGYNSIRRLSIALSAFSGRGHVGM